MTEKPSNNLEEQSNCDHWIKLNGKDIDEHQLTAKIRVLTERFNENKEHLLRNRDSLGKINKTH